MSVVERSTNAPMRSVGFEYEKPLASSDLNEAETLISKNAIEYLEGKYANNTLKIAVTDYTMTASRLTFNKFKYVLMDSTGKEYYGLVDKNFYLTYSRITTSYKLYAYWRVVTYAPGDVIYQGGIRSNSSQSGISEVRTNNNIIDPNLGVELSNRSGVEFTFVLSTSAPTLEGWSVGVQIATVSIEGSTYSLNQSFLDIRQSIDDVVNKAMHRDGSNAMPKVNFPNSSFSHGYGTTASGNYSHAEGYNTISWGNNSHAEGESSLADGLDAHAEGYMTTSSSRGSHAEGSNTEAIGVAAHAEGTGTTADSDSCHTEGMRTHAVGPYSHAEGLGSQGMIVVSMGTASHAEGAGTTSDGYHSHAEGWCTSAQGRSSHTEGAWTVALSPINTEDESPDPARLACSHAEGAYTTAYANCHAEGYATLASGGLTLQGSTMFNGAAHAEGLATEASGKNSHAEGYNTSASGMHSHSEGLQTLASNEASHTEGYGTIASGMHSHAEGRESTASGNTSHAEGWSNVASSTASHAEGRSTIASGDYSHAEGHQTTASDYMSHAEGYGTLASGNTSHAEGTQTVASGDSAHAEGLSNTASGNYSHAEGYNTLAYYSGGNVATASHAEGVYSTAGTNEMQSAISSWHAEGHGTLANGYLGSHAEGWATVASGECSHASGYFTTASGQYQTVVGTFNIDRGTNDSNFIVGGGSFGYNHNDFRAAFGGTYGNTYYTSGADYAEYFEWEDKNKKKKDRTGYFVTLTKNKIKFATSKDDYILGIISAHPTVVGDANEEEWSDKFEKDIYGNLIRTNIHTDEVKDENDRIIVPESDREGFKLSDKFDPTKEYIPRSQRPEWDAVGLLGKLVCRDDGTAEPDDYVYPNDDSIATKVDHKTKFRVLERLDKDHIRIMILNG